MAVDDFVQLPISVDANAMADNAIADLEAQWPGWVPSEGDVEVVVIEAVAPMAADAAIQASNMPAAALRAFGTKCLGIPYDSGAPSITTVTLGLIDTLGHTVPAGGEIEIDGFAFSVDDDVVVAPGSGSVAGVPVTCMVSTTGSNGLTGSIAAPLTLPAFVSTVAVDSATHDGADPQTDDDYVQKVSRDQRLRAKTLTTVTDFVLSALDHAGVGFAWGIGNTARLVTVALAGADGLPVSTAIKDAVEADYVLYRLVNTTYSIIDATYTSVAIAWTVKQYLGWDPVDLKARINAALDAWLAPPGWGQLLPTASGSTGPGLAPNVEPVVRINDVIVKIGSVPGVKTVETVHINGGTTDVTLTGAVPLPTPGTMTGTVDPP